MSQSVERFSSRVENYARYRPGYPTAIVELLESECHLTSESVVADIGSGTGKLSEVFLNNGNVVFGVEPNAAMREAARRLLEVHPGFRSIDAAAESTTLASASVDFVTAGQAFHWFEPDKFKAEVARIIKPLGWAVLIWNERLIDTTPFLRAYEELLSQYGTDYQVVRHENSGEAIKSFFAPYDFKVKSFPNAQEFDFAGLKGRVLSSSYTPESTHPNFEPMLRNLNEIFEKYEKDGRISLDYDTKVYYSQIRS